MIYRIACVGRIKDRYLTELIEKCRREISRYDRIEICEVADECIPKKSSDKLNSQVLEREAARLKKVIGNDTYVIALCVDGKKTDAGGIAGLIKKARELGFNAITFVIGGSLGLDDEIIQKADYRMSISDMTYPHQLMRAVMAEQLMCLSLPQRG